MLEYAFRRILWVIPVIIAVAFVTFILMYRAPGGPWDREKTLPAATMKALDAKFGLDKPLWVNPEAVKYINRLSDHLFVLARFVSGKGADDVLWVPGGNRPT